MASFFRADIPDDTIKAEVMWSMFDAKHNLLSDENLGIGGSTWGVIAEIESEHDKKPFFLAVRKFYLATIKMLKKFPFGDILMKDLGIL